ncbi:bifunctional 4-hydroxy-2-oxoglutarate aldolase/2-dehydro-3-deoxy-phosphogluconate aldolase [uncultured Nisaea sp.]|jgi:2-dehydro-3-deoxyphosphogluconate aldolase / (4S)-4-hydroxy-2-oxoglutarate aldolase|uniref:bifunctional 4-hydroxy-2-oxoglutarate aldolase/2-dehydro-3-deoxy-phosphogluconate aldolase n=1 Tax=uncultured Nisaea sp. TaxID=538215 RepID=UPI0030EE3E0B|tara:strand:+ start:294 stop:938 length:645 start_codon:yes stop_codon:yes gene_type:complete
MLNAKDEALRERLAALKIVPVIRTPSADLAIRACEWLLEAGLQALELTFTTPDAHRVIETFARTAPDALIGAGTVRTPEQAKAAIDAGASFLVSPGAAPGVGEAAAKAGIPYLPGAATPSEVEARWAAGAAVVKIFPARECGGPDFLKAIRSVYPDIPLMPTGGVSPDTAKAYLDAGALCLGMGGELVPVDALKANDPKPVRDAAARALAAAHG